MKTLLIIAATAAHREFLVSCLKPDYTVLTASDGATGVALAAQAEPDLIFLALALPDMASGEVVQHLQAQARLHDVPIIALAAPAMPSADAAVRAIGCVGLLHTPLDEDEVSGLLRRWLGGG